MLSVLAAVFKVIQFGERRDMPERFTLKSALTMSAEQRTVFHRDWQGDRELERPQDCRLVTRDPNDVQQADSIGRSALRGDRM